MSDSDRKDSKLDSSIEEYRLVPIKEDSYFEEDEKIIDFVGLVCDLWDHRIGILKVFALFLVVGVLIYAFGERMYYAETKLMPESNRDSQSGRLLQQYQNIFGVQPNVTEGDELSVNLYPRIVESLPFKIELIQESVYFNELEREATLFEYFSEIRQQSFLQKTGSFLWDISFGLPETISRLFGSSSGEDQAPSMIDFDAFSDFETPVMVDSRVRTAMNSIENWITVQIEPQTGFIVIGTSMPDSQAAAEVVKVVKELLTRYITEYRTDKAVQDLEFIESQYEQSKKRFEATQDSLAAFRDMNLNLQTARAQVMEQRLQSQYNLRFNVYNSLANRLEEAKIKVQEDTPVFRIYEPVTIPTSPSSPDFIRILFGSVFLGFFFGVAMIYCGRLWRKFSTEFKNKKNDPHSKLP
ncbi:MAG: hypothetical protein WD035_07590 [Balneolaceae bacterium]